MMATHSKASGAGGRSVRDPIAGDRLVEEARRKAKPRRRIAIHDRLRARTRECVRGSRGGEQGHQGVRRPGRHRQRGSQRASKLDAWLTYGGTGDRERLDARSGERVRHEARWSGPVGSPSWPPAIGRPRWPSTAGWRGSRGSASRRTPGSTGRPSPRAPRSEEWSRSGWATQRPRSARSGRPARPVHHRPGRPRIEDINSDAVTRVVSSVDRSKSDGGRVERSDAQGPAAFSAVVAPRGPARRAAASARGRVGT